MSSNHVPKFHTPARGGIFQSIDIYSIYTAPSPQLHCASDITWVARLSLMCQCISQPFQPGKQHPGRQHLTIIAQANNVLFMGSYEGFCRMPPQASVIGCHCSSPNVSVAERNSSNERKSSLLTDQRGIENLTSSAACIVPNVTGSRRDILARGGFCL